jgi:hypothetical protein
MSGLGASMAGGNPASGEREERDFYPTPWEVTQALAEFQTFEGPIWEPACGDDAMANVLRANGHKVIATDIHPLGTGAQADFLKIPPRRVRNIVTNPPFDLAVPFIEHGLRMKPDVMAIMLKSTYWHAVRRLPLFQKSKPAWILPMTWRPDFMGKGRPTMECQWTIWLRGNTDYPRYCPLEKPKSMPAAAAALSKFAA